MITGNLSLPPCDGVEIKPGVILIGEPTAIAGTPLLRCLANVGGMLVVVELRMTLGAAQIEEGE